MAKYSNARAMRALIKASLLSILKSPSSVVFTIAFPLVFILVFGFLGNNSNYNIKVAKAPGSDSTSFLYGILQQVEIIKWVNAGDSIKVKQLLKDGDVAAIINIRQMPEGTKPTYDIQLTTPSTQVDKANQLQAIIKGVIAQMDPTMAQRQKELANIKINVTEIKEYKSIDFILPGQLSFSLLATGVFGTAFVFYNLRQTLVLKRFFATPVRRHIIVMSEGIARMIFQIVGSIIIVAIGHFAFGFTLANGLNTFLQMMALCSLGLLLFMGFGFIISSIAKSEGSIPPLANLITLPQFLLAGTFFSIDAFPKWLQPVCRALPLTYLNHALRKLSFDGANLWDVRSDIGILMLWMIGVYFVAGKMFKWE